MTRVVLSDRLFEKRNIPRPLIDDDLQPIEIPVRSELFREISARCVQGSPEKPHILYCPSEFDQEQDFLILAKGFSDLGGTFSWLPYPHGISGLDIESYLGFMQDFFKAFYSWKEASGRGGPLVVMGRSLGTGPAIDCFFRWEERCLCLLLESAFWDTKGLFKALGAGYPEGEEDPFSNREKMQGLKKPVLFIHSHGDSVVSIWNVEWLVSESRSKATQFQIVPSEGRYDLAFKGGTLYFKVIWEYILLRMGIRPKRRPRRRHGSPAKT